MSPILWLVGITALILVYVFRYFLLELGRQFIEFCYRAFITILVLRRVLAEWSYIPDDPWSPRLETLMGVYEAFFPKWFVTMYERNLSRRRNIAEARAAALSRPRM